MNFLCSFSGGVSRLKPREKRGQAKVLAALAVDPMVSTWDMGENELWITIRDMVAKGLLTDETAKVGYPWHRFVVTEAGRKAMEVQSRTAKIITINS